MDDDNYRDLVYSAWKLAHALENLQNILTQLFLSEFVRLDKTSDEKRLVNTVGDLPF